MDLMFTVCRFVFLNLFILGCEGVQILPNYEMSTYNSCEENVVELICKFQYANYTTSPYLTVTWSDVTNSSGHLPMGNILQNRSFTKTAGKGNMYFDVNITRLSAVEQDGSIRLEIPDQTAAYKIFNCEVLASGDTPSIYSRPVFAYNTCTNLTGYPSTPDNTSTTVTPSVCDSTVSPPNVILAAIGIACSVILIIACALGIFFIVSDKNLQCSFVKGPIASLVLLGLCIVLSIVVIAIAAVYLSKEQCSNSECSGLEIAIAVCCLGGILCLAIVAVIRTCTKGGEAKDKEKQNNLNGTPTGNPQ